MKPAPHFVGPITFLHLYNLQELNFMEKITFVIIGGGWRAEFYLRIAKLLPEVFNTSAICVRNKERAEYISKNFNVKVLSSIDEVLKEPFDFIVNCINKEDITDFSVELADKGYYVLSETPIIEEPSSLHNYDKIQVAEQFHLKGTYQAIKRLINEGIIGKINYINISVAHDYHAMSLIRFLLDDYSKPKVLGSYSFNDNVIRTNGRADKSNKNELNNTTQNIKIFKFKNATAVYDYNTEQYFSPIRKDRILIRGTKGEIENDCVKYLTSENEPVSTDIKLVTSGLLDGFYNDKITFENKVLFDFSFSKARLSEEETAIAECLIRMSNYITNGEDLYSYKKAYEDYFYFNS